MRHFGSDVGAIAETLTDAYVEIFTAPPWHHRDPAETRAAFLARLATDAQRPGFRAVVSFSDGGEVAGFVTGWTTGSPFRTDRAYGKVRDMLGAERVDRLLVGAFEVDELGVRQSARGTGLGKRLLSTVTAGRPAWLLTWNQAHDTIAFYRRAGWLELEPLAGKENDIVVFLYENGGPGAR
jgi:ribosomal protein S18 acetylase RimI-like enzyme